MIGPALIASTGERAVDRALRRLVATFEAAFPGRVHSYYLFGSYAGGGAVEGSDVDVFVVFKYERDERETARVRSLKVARHCSLPGQIGVDCVVGDESALLRDGHFRLERGSVLLYGDDIRDHLPPTSLSRYVRTYADAPVSYIAGVIRQTARATYPLTYPDPDGPFYGYDGHVLPPHGQAVPNVKALVSTACWIASMRLALLAGQTAATKGESVRLYREHLGDEWTELVETVFESGKRRWGYLLPSAAADRRCLRDLCRRMLPFENDYLALYRNYALEEARGADADARVLAARRLGYVLYPGPMVTTALRGLTADRDERVRRAASDSLAATGRWA